MKKVINYMVLMTVAFSATTLSSCYKKFDAASYAPALSIGGYTSAKQIAPSSLVGYWGFNGSLVDSVSNNNGTNSGTTFTGGIKGQALQTTGNSYVVYNTPAAVQNLHSFTISAWVNAPQNSTGIAGVLDIANANNFWGNLTIFFENGGTATSGNLKIHVNNNGVDAWLGNYTIPNPWNQWINVAVTYDASSSTFKIFFNGSKIATQTQAGYGSVVFQNATKMVLGTVQFQTTPSLTTTHGTEPWASNLNGLLDEVRIYNVALSETDLGSLVKLEGRGK
jgi:hypothetical protein